MHMKRFGYLLLLGLLLFVLLLCLCTCASLEASVSVPAATEEPVYTPNIPPPVYNKSITISTPSPSPTPSPTPTPTSEPTPEPTATPEPTPFTLCWFSDTQVYSYNAPEVFNSMTEYVADNAQEQNILAVLHTGDIVDSYNGERQWNNAVTAVSYLKGVVPFYCVSGNHDVGMAGNYYEEGYFPSDLCDVREEKYLYEGGKCWYLPFEAAGQKFILLGLGMMRSANTEYTDWAREVLNSHPDHVAIVLTHCYIGHNAAFSDIGKKLEKEIICQCPNVRLVLNGHYHTTARLTKTYEAGHTVTAMVSDYQADTEKGLGFMRLLTFDPGDRSIHVTSYSPYLNSWKYYPDEEKNDFILENAW